MKLKAFFAGLFTAETRLIDICSGSRRQGIRQATYANSGFRVGICPFQRGYRG